MCNGLESGRKGTEALVTLRVLTKLFGLGQNVLLMRWPLESNYISEWGHLGYRVYYKEIVELIIEGVSYCIWKRNV